MPAALYTTLSAIPYNEPDDPGAIPVHAANATTAIRESDCLNHNKEALKQFHHHNNMNDALKTQIIDAVADTYLGEL
jgi:hypothetical protein